MSEHEPTLPERRQAEMLARWLDGQANIPEDLDSDVVEAVLALRPELAPEPALTAEDILADVGAGPLALPERSAPSQPLPPAGAEAEDETEPANRPSRWLAWMGAGLGTVAAAAAVIVLIGGPSLLGSQAPPDGSMARLDEADGVAEAPPLEAEEAEEPAARSARRGGEDADEGFAFETTKDLAGADDTVASKSAEDEPAPARERSLSIPKPGAASAGGSGVVASGSTSRSADTELRSPEPDDVFGDAPMSGGGDAVADLGELEDAVSDENLDQEQDLPSRPAMEEDASEAPVVASAPTLSRAPSTASEELAEVTTLEGNRRSTSSAQKAKKSEEASLESQARPTSTPAAEALAVRVLLQQGKPADARDEAQRLLDGGGLSDLRRADLYYFLGQAHEALGNGRRASDAYREAIRLRQ